MHAEPIPLVESAAPSAWQQSVALFNGLWEQKLINNLATTLTLTLRHSDVIVVLSCMALNFVKINEN